MQYVFAFKMHHWANMACDRSVSWPEMLSHRPWAILIVEPCMCSCKIQIQLILFCLQKKIKNKINCISLLVISLKGKL